MKQILYILAFSFVYSCDNNTRQLKEDTPADTTITQNVDIDSFLTFQYQVNFTNSNISNNSDRKIDLLFNGVDDYLGGRENPNVGFKTECMICLPVQEFNGGLLFGKRLLINDNEIKYYKTNFDISDSTNLLNLISDQRKRTNPKFNFRDGKGSIRFMNISCNDANFYKMRLSFPTGDLLIDSLLNAVFFEYDLNKDGEMEQYIMGMRNCSQELVVLRARK